MTRYLAALPPPPGTMVTVTWRLPGCSSPTEGASGVPASGLGMTGSEGLVGSDLPALFTATAVTVYGVPLVNSSIRQVFRPTSVSQALPPGRAVTTYFVGTLPSAPRARVISIEAFLLVTLVMVGVPGLLPGSGVTASDFFDGSELPKSFIATTVKVYGVPLVRPLTMQ